MIKNYFKIAWRNIWNNKLFSFINIAGLALGVTCCVLIFLYVQNELSFDAFHKNADRIYRMTAVAYQPNKVEYFAPTSPIMSKQLAANFPEIQKAVRLNYSGGLISYGDKKMYDIKKFYVDSTFLDIFSFDLIEGDPKKALTSPYSLVLTESTAKKYFGKESAYGKMLKIADTINMQVTGIIKDVPQNSYFTFDCLISRSTMVDMNKNDESWSQNNEGNWFNCNTYSYLLLAPGTNAAALEAKANKFMDKEMADIKKDMGMWFHIKLQPLKDIHLRSRFTHDFKDAKIGDIIYVYIFSATAILILLIACCNFINLATARSVNRSKEIGLRKVIGAARSQLVSQFLGESLMVATLASLISFLLLTIAIPLFNSFIGTDLSMNSTIILIYVAIILSVGLLAGLYPALLMSSFSPIRSLKGHVTHGLMDIVFRKGLVVFQFSIAVVLIIGTVLILRQLEFMQNKRLGINKDQVMAIALGFGQKNGKLLKDELSSNPKITGATLTNFTFKGTPNITLVPEGAAQNEVTACNVISVDENFMKTMQVSLVAGRDFSKDFPTDVNDAFMVNEAAVKAFNWKTPREALGKKVSWGMGKEGKIIGVTSNFNYASLHEDVKPLLINIFQPWFGNLLVRVKPENIQSTVAEVENTWKKTMGDAPFKYTFLEDDFNSLYRSEQNMRAVLTAFTFLSVLVACLGLFGLAAFSIRQRVREIGIRKVLGSSVNGIVQLVTKDFIKLVVISIAIAIPVGWYAVYKWLQDFAYKTDISLWIFAVAGFSALLIAFVTVAVQAMKAASVNPVKSLRTE